MDTLFCPECHNILDLPTEDNIITCDACQSVQNASVFEGQVSRTFSKEGQYGDIFQKTITSKGSASNEGAKIKERCPKCGNPEMTFHTMQLRSADEGQTVFYSCPKCRYKYKLNT